MRGLTLGLGFNTGPGFVPYDPAYEPEMNYIINAAQIAGYSLPTDACLDLQNTFLATLKTAGIWTRLDHLSVYASTATTQDYALINWKNPYGQKLLTANAPTYTVKSGFKGDGVSADINTYFVPFNGVNWQLDDAACYVWVYAIPTVGSTIRGVSNNAHERIVYGNGNTNRINAGGGNSAITINYTGTGMKGLNRTSSTNIEAFNNLVQTSTTQSSSVKNNTDQYLFRTNTVYCDVGVSMILYGANLVTQNTDLYNAFNDYMTNLAALP